MLPDKSVLIRQNMEENAKIQKFKCDILSNFQTICFSLISYYIMTKDHFIPILELLNQFCDLGTQIALKWKLMRMILQDFFLLDATAVGSFIELVVLSVVVLIFPSKGVALENG